MSGPAAKRIMAQCAMGVGLLGAVCASAADAVDNSTEVICLLQSASLNFGRLGLHRPPLVAGEGEMVVVCQNTATALRRVNLALAFPTMGQSTAWLQSGRGTLAVAFFHDTQFAVRWGEDGQGLAALHIPLELGAGERRLLRLPVYALLQNPPGAAAGIYVANLPVTVSISQP